MFKFVFGKPEQLLMTNEKQVYLTSDENGLIFKNNENKYKVSEGFCKILLSPEFDKFGINN
jgi:hypothetical protein